MCESHSCSDMARGHPTVYLRVPSQSISAVRPTWIDSGAQRFDHGARRMERLMSGWHGRSHGSHRSGERRSWRRNLIQVQTATAMKTASMIGSRLSTSTPSSNTSSGISHGC